MGPEISLFLAGAPKCGTTSLYSYLSRHPAIFFPEVKEPHFFSTDLPGLRITSDSDAYLELFADAPAGAVLGDASASYIHSDVAVPLIVEAYPNARFVVILRHPVDQVYAMHSELLANLTEDEPDFESAWHLQERRRRGEQVPRRAAEPRMLQYAEIGRLGSQLERLSSRVAPERLLVLLLDDLRQNPKALYLQILAFLGLEDDGQDAFPAANERHGWRSRRLAKLHRDLPALLGPLFQPARAIGGRVGGLSRIMDRANRVAVRKQEMDPALRRHLCEMYREEVDKVERLLGRELPGWRV